MPKFKIEMIVVERTRQRIMVEAETLDQAILMVEGYELDNDEFEVFDSLEWSISDVQAEI